MQPFFHQWSILIIAMPLVSFVAIIFFGQWLKDRVSHLIATWMMMLVIVCATGVLLEKVLGLAPVEFLQSWDWIRAGDLIIPFAVYINNPAAITMFMTAVTAGMIHLFSQGYMKGDVRYSRFFALISLFTFSMLGVVLADHLIAFYIFWEIMGFCSYALIGFYFEKRSAQLAMKKAFIVTRIGDVGMFIGIVLLYFSLGTVRISELGQVFSSGQLPLSQTMVTIIGLLIFAGAIGKSAQFPLHVWLPDAMEGPTPVSALIHAATMVSAGVYLVVRMYPVISASGTTLAVVAAVGAFTAFFTALIGLVMKDIKRVLAYSTMSQLGYMFLGLGVLGFTGGVFHLINHAFFKAGLFLGSGSVILGCHHEQDMRRMGGLAKFMPITFWTFLILSLSLMGIPPFSGFWSKDEVLGSAFARAHELGGLYWLLWVLGEIAAFLTAAYMTRLLILTFSGRYRGNDAPPEDYLEDKARLEQEQVAWETRRYGESLGGLATLYQPAEEAALADGGEADGASTGGAKAEEASEQHHHAPRESPWVVTVPLIVLAAFAALFGFVGAAPLGIHSWERFIHFGHGAPEEVNWLVVGISTLMALGGAGTGWVIWGQRPAWVTSWYRMEWVKRLELVLVHKFYFDEFYEAYIVRPVVQMAKGFAQFDFWVIDLLVNAIGAGTKMFAYVYAWFDLWVVDGTVNLVGYFWLGVKRVIRPVQSGNLQHYMLAILFFAVAFFIYRYLV